MAAGRPAGLFTRAPGLGSSAEARSLLAESVDEPAWLGVGSGSGSGLGLALAESVGERALRSRAHFMNAA